MQFPTQFPFLVIPTGAGPGQQRITINFNQDGQIKVYDANGNLVDSLGGAQGQFLIYDTVGNLIVSLASAAGTDPNTGDAFYQGIGTYDTSGNSININGSTAEWFNTNGSYVNVTASVNAEIFLLPQNNVNGPWVAATVGTSIAGGGHPSLDLESPSSPTGGGAFATINLQGGSIAQPTFSQIFYSASEHKFDNEITVYNNAAWNSWTPAITNGASITYTTQFGWYVVIGQLVFFGFYIVVNAAGTGTNIVGLSAPLAIERTGRQAVAFNGDAITGFSGSLTALALRSGEGGSGANFERIRSSTGSNMLSNSVISGTILTGTGWYRST